MRSDGGEVYVQERVCNFLFTCIRINDGCCEQMGGRLTDGCYEQIAGRLTDDYYEQMAGRLTDELMIDLSI